MKEHPEHSDYLIGEDGSIFSMKTKKKLSPYVSDNGYMKIKINKKILYVHRLVAQTYIENPKNLPQVNHIDCNKLNNKIENLEWVTNAKNANHRANEWLIKDIKSGEERIVKNLHIFCLENNLPKSQMYKVAGTGKVHKGMIVECML